MHGLLEHFLPCSLQIATALLILPNGVFCHEVQVLRMYYAEPVTGAWWRSRT